MDTHVIYVVRSAALFILFSSNSTVNLKIQQTKCYPANTKQTKIILFLYHKKARRWLSQFNFCPVSRVRIVAKSAHQLRHVRPSKSPPLSLYRIPSDFILEVSIKIFQENPNVFKIGWKVSATLHEYLSTFYVDSDMNSTEKHFCAKPNIYYCLQ